MGVFQIGEVVHIIEKRLFVDDIRRHFVGEVLQYSDSVLRVKGYTWVYHSTKAQFIRRQGIRERVIILGDRTVINILPKGVDPQSILYQSESGKRHIITDGKKFTLELTGFLGG